MDLGADAADAVLVQVLQGVLAHVGDVPGDLLGAQLGIPGLGLVLFNVDGGEHILPDQALVQQDGCLLYTSDTHKMAEANKAFSHFRW